MAESTLHSPEYNTIKKRYDMLVDFLKPSIRSLGDRLFAKGLIPEDLNDKLTMNSITEADKARDVLKHLLTCIKLNSSVYDAFVELLKQDPSNIELLEKLNTTLNSLKLWSNEEPDLSNGAGGRRDVLYLVPDVSTTDNSDIVPRRSRGPLTEEERRKLEEQGIHRDCQYTDLSIMMARFTFDERYTIVRMLPKEEMDCMTVKKQITNFMNNTVKEGGM